MDVPVAGRRRDRIDRRSRRAQQVSAGTLIATVTVAGPAAAPRTQPRRRRRAAPRPAMRLPAPAARRASAGRHRRAPPGALDLVVLGAGPGGYTAAFRAADLGLKVTLIERWPMLGGVCLNVGCIPSKALLHAAKVIEDAADMAACGIVFGPPQIDRDRLRAWKNKVVTKLTNGLALLAKQRKVDVRARRGEVRRVRYSLELRERRGRASGVDFKQCIIAAGSESVRLPGFPDDPRVIDSSGALELPQDCKRLLVVGGGIIGLEMACVYDALGAERDGGRVERRADAGHRPRSGAAAAKAHREALRAHPAQDHAWPSSRRAPRACARPSRGPMRRRRRNSIGCWSPSGRSANGNAIDAAAAGVAVDTRGIIARRQADAHQCAAYLRHRRHRRRADAGAQGHPRRQGGRGGGGRTQVLVRRALHSLGGVHRSGNRLGGRHRDRGQGARHRVRQGHVSVGRERPLARAQSRRGLHQAAVRQGDAPRHRRRASSAPMPAS